MSEGGGGGEAAAPEPPSHSRLCCSSGEEIEITFSYWDGSGHRKTVKVAWQQLQPRRFSPRVSSVLTRCVCVCVRASCR